MPHERIEHTDIVYFISANANANASANVRGHGCLRYLGFTAFLEKATLRGGTHGIT